MPKGKTQLLVGACLVVAVGLTLFPIAWMLATAFKAPDQIFAGAGFLPWPITFGNFTYALARVPMLRLFANSLGVALAITAGQVLTSILAAYGFARYNFLGRDLLFYAFLATMLLPVQAMLIPNYLLVSDLGWLGTYQALIVPHLASAFGVFLLRQHLRSFPMALVEAARLDGATNWQVLWQIILPSSTSAIAALSVLSFINAWNDYLWPLLVAPDGLVQTLPIGIQTFVNLEGGNQWGPLMAAATLATVPALIAYVVAQRQILDSFVGAGIKG